MEESAGGVMTLNAQPPSALDESAMREAVGAYLAAFAERDLERCLAFFTEDARLDFQISQFEGKLQIAEWHRDRFAANLRLVRLERITVKRDTVTVDAIGSSDRLAAWNVQALPGRITLRFADGRIASCRFAARMVNPINLIRSGD
jgi:ketosteroid isomerase-like protein